MSCKDIQVKLALMDCWKTRTGLNNLTSIRQNHSVFWRDAYMGVLPGADVVGKPMSMERNDQIRVCSTGISDIDETNKNPVSILVFADLSTSMHLESRRFKFLKPVS